MVRLVASLLLVTFMTACGQKGPPRPPLRIVPASIVGPTSILEAVSTDTGPVEAGGNTVLIARMSDRVYLTFWVPSSDSDGSTPGDIERVEVYGITTQPTARRPTEVFSEDWLEAATLVATVPVRLPDLSPQHVEDNEQQNDETFAMIEDGFVAQGELVTIVERLTPETMVPVTIGEENEREVEDNDETDRPIPMPFVGPPLPMPRVRSYVAFGVSSTGREGDASAMVSVPLVTPPDSPSPVTIEYTAGTVRVEWEAPEQGRPLGQTEEPLETFLESEPILLEETEALEYVIFDLVETGDPDIELPLMLGPPGEQTSYTDSNVTYGTTACYAVRMLEHVDEELEIYGDASPATCIVFMDTYPPAAPTGLIAVSDIGSISLVWDDNGESDLAGYVVLRGLASDATLQPLTPDPLTEPTFQDVDIVAGEQYIYQVVAVDNAVPPNVSQPSDQITESAR